MSQDAAATAYYDEVITIHLDRLTLICIIGACILALKHPEFTTEPSHVVKDTIRLLMPMVIQHLPDDVLNEWDQVVGIP